MATIISRNLCLIFFRDPRTEFTPARIKELLAETGLTVKGEQEPFKVCWGNGPVLQISIRHIGKHAETLVRGLVGRGRKHRSLIPGCDAFIEIQLSDVESVLDEINTLIEVQATLQTATRGLMYLSWNNSFSAPSD